MSARRLRLPHVLAVAGLLAVGSLACAARAEDAAPADGGFGARSAVAISVERIAGLQSQQFGDVNVDSVGFHPLFWAGLGAHYVTRSGFTFGALLGATHFTLQTQGARNTTESLRKTMIWFRPRVGYARSLYGPLALWARLGPTGLVFADSDKKTHRGLSAGAEVYAVVAAAPHVHVLLGPHYEIPIYADENASKYGSLGLTLGLMGELY